MKAVTYRALTGEFDGRYEGMNPSTIPDGYGNLYVLAADHDKVYALAVEMRDALKDCISNLNFARIIMDKPSRDACEPLLEEYRTVLAKAKEIL